VGRPQPDVLVPGMQTYRVTELIGDQDTAATLGRAARSRVCDEYLAPRFLDRYFRLLMTVLPEN
jgi:hypothetical protein